MEEGAASLAGVMEPDATLLEGVDVVVGVKPLAACAYEKDGVGAATGADAFSVAEVILMMQTLKSCVFARILVGSSAVADELSTASGDEHQAAFTSPHPQSRRATRKRSFRDG